MIIVGEWWTCTDGTTRPTVRINVDASGGRLVDERFLVDSAADRTVFSAALLARLQLPTQTAPSGLAFQGIGGQTAFVVIATVLALLNTDGGVARINGQFAAFTDPRRLT